MKLSSLVCPWQALLQAVVYSTFLTAKMYCTMANIELPRWCEYDSFEDVFFQKLPAFYEECPGNSMKLIKLD